MIYDPIPDLAAVLAGLQVPLSIDRAILGAAGEPLLELRKWLNLKGWPDSAEHEKALRNALALCYRERALLAAQEIGEIDT